MPLLGGVNFSTTNSWHYSQASLQLAAAVAAATV